MKSWILVASAALAAALAGCSGGGAVSSSTSGGGTSTVADLVVTTDVQTLSNTGTQTATVTVTAVDANRNSVADAPITLVPDNNAIVTLSSATTDSTGKVTATLAIGSDHSNRAIDVVATSGSHSLTVTGLVSVVGAKLTASANATTLTAGETGSIVYTLVDASSNPMVSLPIEVKGPTTVDGTTDANGKFTYTYTAPATPTDSLPIDATAGGATTETDIAVVSSSIPVNPNAVLSASLATSVNNIPVNPAGVQTNQVTVRALFVGANNAPLENIRVRFDTDGDLNNVGGTLTAGSGSGNPVYSDVNGIATTTYIPGTHSSPIDGLTLRACWSNNDFAPVANGAACPNNQEIKATLTVTDAGVSISIFNDATIGTPAGRQTYTIPFAIQVVDSAGEAQTGVKVTGTVDLPFYMKGFYDGSTGAWVQVGNVLPGHTIATCYNEDINRNGVNEVFSNGQKEDANGNHVLDPHKADVEIYPTSTGSDTTDQWGKAYFTLEYGQNVASWDWFTLTATAIVAGTEGQQTYEAILPVPASVLQDVTTTPPFAVSPYGISDGLPTTIVTDPSSGVSAPLCTNAH